MVFAECLGENRRQLEAAEARAEHHYACDHQIEDIRFPHENREP